MGMSEIGLGLLHIQTILNDMEVILLHMDDEMCILILRGVLVQCKQMNLIDMQML